jgi:hypothetical protein
MLAFANRRIRGQTEALLRALNRRCALEPGDLQATADRQRLELFRDGLDPPTPRRFIVTAIVVTVFLVQLVIATVASRGFGESLGALNDVLGKSTGGDPGSISELGAKLASARPNDLAVLVVIASIVSYLVFRGAARGYSRAQQLLPVTTRETRVRTSLGAAQVVDLPFDLAVRALLAIGAVSYGTVALSYQTSIGFDQRVGPEIYAAAGIGVIGLLDLGWLGYRWRRTGSSLMPFLGACALIAAICVGAELSAWR